MKRRDHAIQKVSATFAAQNATTKTHEQTLEEQVGPGNAELAKLFRMVEAKNRQLEGQIAIAERGVASRREALAEDAGIVNELSQESVVGGGLAELSEQSNAPLGGDPKQ
eukprot:scaffold1483_cov379-Prasinococcus_capsulatus_cf.AAC.13